MVARSCAFTSACFFWMAGQFFQVELAKLACLPIGIVFVAFWSQAYVRINKITTEIYGDSRVDNYQNNYRINDSDAW